MSFSYKESRDRDYIAAFLAAAVATIERKKFDVKYMYNTVRFYE